MTEAGLAELRADHVEVRGLHFAMTGETQPDPHCDMCEEPWPCAVRRLLTALDAERALADRLAAALEAVECHCLTRIDGDRVVGETTVIDPDRREALAAYREARE